MARPALGEMGSASPATRVLIDASVNVAFLLLLAFFFIISPRGGTLPEVVSSSKEGGIRGRRDGGDVFQVESYGERCEHVAEEDGLDRRRFPRGYVDYLYLFDCVFGAPDALSTIASFASGGGEGEATAVGLNGVLGSAMLVSSAVLGIIGVHLGARGDAIDRVNFYCDASFLLVSLVAVAVVLAAGEVTIWGALAFTSLYVVYVVAVAFTHGRSPSKGHDAEADHSADAFFELCNVAETKFYGDQEPLLPETTPPVGLPAERESAHVRKLAIRSQLTCSTSLNL
uniref:Sodium/calcium exchanger membrane region domain-containing protein n=1 Tax=Oryza glumipatula TaxID=40148 RepID=A0A0E0BEG7_9ORYZ